MKQEKSFVFILVSFFFLLFSLTKCMQSVIYLLCLFGQKQQTAVKWSLRCCLSKLSKLWKAPKNGESSGCSAISTKAGSTTINIRRFHQCITRNFNPAQTCSTPIWSNTLPTTKAGAQML